MAKLFDYKVSGLGLNSTLSARFAERVYILLQKGRFSTAHKVIDEAEELYTNGGEELLLASIYRSTLPSHIIEVLADLKIYTWFDLENDEAWDKISSTTLRRADIRKIKNRYHKFKTNQGY